MDSREFTISITPVLEKRLDKAKKEYYYDKTQEDMIRELIVLGLSSFINKNQQV